MKKTGIKTVLIGSCWRRKTIPQEILKKMGQWEQEYYFSNDIKAIKWKWCSFLEKKIKDLKIYRILTNQNLADKEVYQILTSQLLEMLEKLDKMKQEKEILSLELGGNERKTPFGKIFGR